MNPSHSSNLFLYTFLVRVWKYWKWHTQNYVTVVRSFFSNKIQAYVQFSIWGKQYGQSPYYSSRFWPCFTKEKWMLTWTKNIFLNSHFNGSILAKTLLESFSLALPNYLKLTFSHLTYWFIWKEQLTIHTEFRIYEYFPIFKNEVF